MEVMKIMKAIKQLEKELIDLYEPIVTYNNGQFQNLSGSDDEKRNELSTVFPSYKELAYNYVSEIHKLLENDELEHIPLPPFVVFPTYSSTTIGWRMGLGEIYESDWMQVIRTLSNEELMEYCSHYIYPMWWVMDNQYKDIVNPRYYKMPWISFRNSPLC